MNYNWERERIRNHRKHYTWLLTHTSGLTKQDKNSIQQKIKELKELEMELMQREKSLFSLMRQTTYIDSSKTLPKNTYYDYLDIPYFIKDTILDVIPCFRNCYDCYEQRELPQTHLSNQELIDMAYDFWKWIGDDSYTKSFLKYTNPKHHLLRFSRNLEGDNIGQTHFFYYPTYLPYFSIRRDGTINDFCTLNHEIAHGIFYQNEISSANSRDHYYLLELEGCFFDYLSIQYLKDKISEEMVTELEYGRSVSFYEMVVNFYITHLSICLFQQRKKIDIIPIQKKIMRECLPITIDNGSLLSSLHENPSVTAKYLISHLISLDIEHYFELDREKAFYLFKIIRNSLDWSIFSYLEEKEHITIMDHQNHYPMLRKSMKKFYNTDQNNEN